MNEPKMDKEILQLCESFWQFQLDESPELSTYKGYHTGNDKLDEFTTVAYERRKDFCKDNLFPCATRIQQDNRYPLTSFENKINLELVQQYLETFIKGVQYRPYLSPFNLYEGVDVYIAKCCISRMHFDSQIDYGLLKNVLSNFNGQGIRFKSYLVPPAYSNGIELWFCKYLVSRIPIICEQHYRDYMCRCRAYKAQILDVIELMKTGIEQGIMPHSSGMGMVITRIDRVLSSEPEDTPYYMPYLNMPESISKETQCNLRIEGRNLIREFIYKSLEVLRNFISEVYIPSCRKELSVCSLPDGDARYAAMLKFHCDVDLSPEQMHQIGHEQVKLVRSKIEQVLRKLNFNGTIQEFFAQVQQDESLHFSTQEEAMKYMNDVLENTIRPKLGQLFKPAPKYDIIIADVILGAQPVLAEYIGPTSTKPAVLHFAKTAAKRLMKYEVLSLMLHEAEPGHHFQASYMVGQEDLPKFRRHKDDRRYYEAPGRFPLNTAYTEGWGLYCEELGDELGIYDDPYSEFGYLTWRLARAVRLVVDTGIHAFKWTREQAQTYMAENSNLSYDRRQLEIDRYITWPGQACAYTIGHMKIAELRRKATEKLGSAFDVREFHEVCLKCGQVPLQILEKIVDNYIEQSSK